MDSVGSRTILTSVLGAALLCLATFGPSAAVSAPIPDEPNVSPDSEYLDQLLVEINTHRVLAGTSALIYIAPEANQAVSRYLSDLTPVLVSRRACFHGSGSPIAPGWDYVAATGLVAEPRGEVLACPDDKGYWTAQATADGWWRSPIHAQLLYRDQRINAIACGTYGSQRGATAFETIACVTYRS